MTTAADHHGALPLGLCLWLLACCGCGALKDDDGGAEYPSRPIKLIVPFAAGGGTDAFARTIKKAIDDNQLLDQPLVIINVGGGGATIGSRRVKNARPDGHTVLLLHDGLMMSKYSGKVPYGPESFTPVAGTGESTLLVAAPHDSPYADLRAAVEAAYQRPGEIIFGCNLGTPTHFAGLMLEQERPGARFRYVQTGDGAQRFAALKGRHIDLTVFSLAEYLRFREDGIRALGYLGSRRHQSIPDVPTAKEQGLDVQWSLMQYWWMPRGAPPQRTAHLAGVLEQAMQTQYVQRKLAEVHTEPVFIAGEELEERIDSVEQRVSQVDLRSHAALPDFPLLVAIAAGLVALVVVAQTWIQHKKQSRAAPGDAELPVESLSSRQLRAGYAKAAVVILLTFIYVVLMAAELVPFRVATIVFALVTGLLLAGHRRRALPGIIAAALILGFGLHYLFTELFVIDLP